MTTTATTEDRLGVRIVWGLAIGLGAGLLARLLGHHSPAVMAGLHWLATEVMDPFGQVFLRILFFVVVPLVFTSLTYGIVQLGRLDRLGPLAGRTLLLFGLNMIVAVALGLLIMNTVRPGYRLSPESQAKLIQQYQGDAHAAQAKAEQQPRLTFTRLVEMFMPRNLLGAVVNMDILPLILFAGLVGAAGTQLPADHRRRFMDGLEIANELMIRIVRFAMRLAPYAVAAMMSSLVINVGTDVLQALLIFVLAVLGGLLAHLVGTLSVLLKLFTRRSPLRFFRSIRTVLVTAFSTSSSSATLPTSIQVSRENLGISPATAGFVLPLGATMNMSGTALYEGCVVLFVAQVFDVHLSLGNQATLLLLTVLSAVAVAGIPGASLPVMVGLMASFKIPPEGIALILGVERLLDMARTTLNVAADVVTACIVDERARPRTDREAPDPGVSEIGSQETHGD